MTKYTKSKSSSHWYSNYEMKWFFLIYQYCTACIYTSLFAIDMGVKRLVLQYWWPGTWAGLLSFNVRILVKQTTEWIPGIEVSVWKLLVSLIQSCMISVFHHCLLLNNSLLKMCLEIMLSNCLNKSRNSKMWSYVSNFNYFESFIFLLFVKCKCRVCKCCRFGGGGGGPDFSSFF